MNSPGRSLVGGPNVINLLLREVSIGPVWVIPLEGFGNDFGVPIGVDPRYNVFDFLVVVLAVLHHLKIRHNDDGVCEPPSLMVTMVKRK